ncbi:Shikimate dehydrogenase (NADP(+)) [Frankliniella fusca]|uniref:Shikimate dehydrogenase (NADP(+)) n=1 Tax=Frankliniella fusca TaxID=407009 RepID=A0AAE1LLJ9_9NEOP|nr:Shikimate dehydrogenase (NADP(+)) [Frankliniella fusca]
MWMSQKVIYTTAAGTRNKETEICNYFCVCHECWMKPTVGTKLGFRFVVLLFSGQFSGTVLFLLCHLPVLLKQGVDASPLYPPCNHHHHSPNLPGQCSHHQIG